ncbi:MAG: tRNA lysidine(34) synthetase TilS [Verrucomicrobiae bacterium]|nr:tRNA lysidine(34) synthetase TilS [Verrucomicrobiae bacterium]
MKYMLTALDDFFAKQPFLRKNQPHLVAVSGGLDSVCLLHALQQAGCRRLHVAHFNHRLRARQSDSDQRFVKSLAEEWGLPFHAGQENVKALARRQKLSIETAAREARYAWFRSLAGTLRIPRIFLAHHAGDQIETFLQRLFRGTGMQGLCAMEPVARQQGLILLRPFLTTPRATLTDFATARGLDWREDPSNASPEFQRNRVRHELIPLLNDIFKRDVSPNILRTIEILTEDHLALRPAPTPVRFPVTALRKMSVALQRRTIHAWLCVRHKIAGVTFEQVENVRALALPGNPTHRCNLSRGNHVSRRQGLLRIEKNQARPLAP